MGAWQIGLQRAQLLITAGMVAKRWPESQFLFTSNLGSFAMYALMANILYSFAYLPEAVLQLPRLAAGRKPARTVIFGLGTMIACCLTTVVLDMQLLRDPTDD